MSQNFLAINAKDNGGIHSVIYNPITKAFAKIISEVSSGEPIESFMTFYRVSSLGSTNCARWIRPGHIHPRTPLGWEISGQHHLATYRWDVEPPTYRGRQVMPLDEWPYSSRIIQAALVLSQVCLLLSLCCKIKPYGRFFVPIPLNNKTRKAFKISLNCHVIHIRVPLEIYKHRLKLGNKIIK